MKVLLTIAQLTGSGSWQYEVEYFKFCYRRLLCGPSSGKGIKTLIRQFRNNIAI